MQRLDAGLRRGGSQSGDIRREEPHRPAVANRAKVTFANEATEVGLRDAELHEDVIKRECFGHSHLLEIDRPRHGGC